MRIASGTVDFSSTHLATERSTRSESMHTWIGDRRPDFEGDRGSDRADGRGRGVRGRGDDGDQAGEARHRDGDGPRALLARRLAGLARQLGAEIVKAKREHERTEPSNHGTSPAGNSDEDDALQADPKSLAIKLIVEAMTGKKIKLVSLGELKDAQVDGEAAAAAMQQGGQQAERVGWGLEYDLHETHDEVEQTGFSAEGVVKTADGKEITFTYELEMERQFHSETTVSVRAGDAKLKDPLVINFGGTAAQLADRIYAFDLDADGKKDQVAWVLPGSGLLALDKNDNGAIDDGSELFGAKSGDGFAELAAYDDDHNGWIDEADAVYGKLQVWSKSGGSDQLASLKDRDVGAINLGHLATPFQMKDAANQLQGAVRSSGIYVKEDGSGVGSVQQIDLAL